MKICWSISLRYCICSNQCSLCYLDQATVMVVSVTASTTQGKDTVATVAFDMAIVILITIIVIFIIIIIIIITIIIFTITITATIR